MKITVSSNNIHIQDSCFVKSKDFDGVLSGIINDFPSHNVVVNRSKGNMKREWAVHNLCYKLGIYTTRTHDVDINYPLSTIETLVYDVLGWPCYCILRMFNC